MSDNESNDDFPVPPAKEGKSEEVFEVERILNHKVTDDNLLLLVRWSGYNSDEDTWEPEEDLRDTAEEVVLEYYREMKVNDKTELIGTIHQQIKRNKAQLKDARREKRRERISSDEEDTCDSDESSTAPKPKKNRKTKKNTPSSSSITPRIETKASRKSYVTPKSIPAIPNNAKKTAMEIRDNRWDLGDDSDNSDTEVAELDDIAKMQMKVMNKSGTTHAGPKAEREKIESPRTEGPSSSNSHKSKERSETRASSQHKNDASPIVEKSSESLWTVEGIVPNGDERRNRKKMVLMKNSITGQEKVLTAEDAFKLGGWALTKYLLDRCEF
ncbi:hypothetical protein CAEBREN_06438 [Caenorhabditis brenneri]|uniref:Chromo domain-containing protein n=1 Tax=Caenorhabditis brenneri TaxID=135651 RepID=G0P2F0_CAEBE|nr:hypothetical protein CAEBREN_06438 [Caenorhabditis brenneri]